MKVKIWIWNEDPDPRLNHPEEGSSRLVDHHIHVPGCSPENATKNVTIKSKSKNCNFKWNSDPGLNHPEETLSG